MNKLRVFLIVKSSFGLSDQRSFCTNLGFLADAHLRGSARLNRAADRLLVKPYPVIGGVKYVFDPPTLTEDFRKIFRGLF